MAFLAPCRGDVRNWQKLEEKENFIEGGVKVDGENGTIKTLRLKDH